MTAVALPWLVLVTTGSPTRTGGVLAAEYGGLIVLGLLGGPVVGAIGPRRVMLGSDLIRALLVAAIPLLYAAGTLSYPVLLLVGFTVGGFFPAYTSSQRLVAAGLLGADELRLTRFNGLSGAVNEAGSFVGPALAGVLIVVLTAPGVLLLDAASYLVAFGLVAALIPAVPRRPSTVDNTSIGAGLRYLREDRARWRELVGVGVVVLGNAAMTATLPVLALRSGGGPSAAGWLIGAFGAGSVLGGLISARASTTDGPTATRALSGMAAASVVMLFVTPLWIVGVLVGLIGVSTGLYFPRLFAAVTTSTPEPLRGTVLTAVNVLISAPGPVGFLGAGLLNQYLGGRGAGLILMAGATLVGAALVAAARTVGQRPARTGSVCS